MRNNLRNDLKFLIALFLIAVLVVFCFPLKQTEPNQILLPPLEIEISDSSFTIKDDNYNLTLQFYATNYINSTIEIYSIALQGSSSKNNTWFTNKQISGFENIEPSNIVWIDAWIEVPIKYFPGFLTIIFFTDHGIVADAILLPLPP